MRHVDETRILAYVLKDRMLRYQAYTFSTLERIENSINADDEQIFRNGVGRFTELKESELRGCKSELKSGLSSIRTYNISMFSATSVDYHGDIPKPSIARSLPSLQPQNGHFTLSGR